MFFNLKKLYLFLGCIVFFINNFASDFSSFMKLGFVNYAELDTELANTSAQINKKSDEQFVKKTEISLLSGELRSMMLLLNQTEEKLGRIESLFTEKMEKAVMVEVFDFFIGRLLRQDQQLKKQHQELEKRCQVLEQDNVKLKRDLEDLKQKKLDLREMFVDFNQGPVQRLTLLVLELQEKMRNLEESEDDSASPPLSWRSSTPPPDQITNVSEEVSHHQKDSDFLFKLAFTEHQVREKQAQKLNWQRLT